MKKRLLYATVIAALGFGLATASQAAETKLKAASFLPKPMAGVKYFTQAWEGRVFS